MVSPEAKRRGDTTTPWIISVFDGFLIAFLSPPFSPPNSPAAIFKISPPHFPCFLLRLASFSLDIVYSNRADINIFRMEKLRGAFGSQNKKDAPPMVEKEPSHDRESNANGLINTPVRRLTWRSAVMGLFVSMGGFVFGYDTGQISGILEMKDFLQRFGELQSDGTYSFSNVRSGLIVAMVCHNPSS